MRFEEVLNFFFVRMKYPSHLRCVFLNCFLVVNLFVIWFILTLERKFANFYILLSKALLFIYLNSFSCASICRNSWWKFHYKYFKCSPILLSLQILLLLLFVLMLDLWKAFVHPCYCDPFAIIFICNYWLISFVKCIQDLLLHYFYLLQIQKCCFSFPFLPPKIFTWF